MEEQFNREAKEGWRFAADAARITDERASGEDGKHMSGGFFVAVDSCPWRMTLLPLANDMVALSRPSLVLESHEVVKLVRYALAMPDHGC